MVYISILYNTTITVDCDLKCLVTSVTVASINNMMVDGDN